VECFIERLDNETANSSDYEKTFSSALKGVKPGQFQRAIIIHNAGTTGQVSYLHILYTLPKEL